MQDTPSSATAQQAGEPVPEVAGRWRSEVVLKQDVFSTVERGTFTGPEGERTAVLRRIDLTPWWSRVVARHFLRREARALEVAGPLGIAPRLLHAGSAVLVRSWIDGAALHVARPLNDRVYFRSARAALHQLHRAGVCHNDLAKPQNWLRGRDGRAYLTDFQLAWRFRRRGRIFRLAAYEDLRHLLKQKRRYAPDLLTASERRILARKSLIARLWLTLGKPVYHLFTRRLLGYVDREGAGPRLAVDAPALAAAMKAHPGVRDVAILAYPDRRAGTGLYAFVEADAVAEAALRGFLAANRPTVRPPECIQIVDALPRDAGAGTIRTEWLSPIATNQLDLIDTLDLPDAERRLLARIASGRRNLMDRYGTPGSAT